MHLLFPSDLSDRHAPDADFEAEATAAQNAGFAVVLFSLERLREGNAASAVAATGDAPTANTPILHRGWMLMPAEYAALFDVLRERRGYQMVVSPDAYAEAHYLPNAYAHLAGLTPESVWTQGADIDAAWQLYEAWSRPATVVKDYVKSAKHRWNTACFLPEGSDREHFGAVLSALVAYRGGDFAGGYVLRRFAPLRQIGTTDWGQPIHEEYRLFFWRGVCIAHPPAFPGDTATWGKIAARFASAFVCMDIAHTDTGEWIIVEVGDGGVSGLPDGVTPEAFYRSLIPRL
ncbi:MAG: ATP-grasp domain-containing protein [Armatimonadetes bacterium]|nr:ATP-grasp domain-containing protein [Armatimonadota bacterium]